VDPSLALRGIGEVRRPLPARRHRAAAAQAPR
jgi:hypothetical protein